MNDSLLKLEIENLRELLRLKDLNNELLEANHNLLERLLHEYIKQGIPLEPEIGALLIRTKQILNQIADQPTFDTNKNNRRFDRTLFKYT